jgi:hypothetical protein
VFNENSTPYKFDTIGGDFGNAQIVINPHLNGMYVVDIYRDVSNSV